MKLPLIRKRRKGAILLVIIVMVALLIFLGYTLWQIYKMLQHLPISPTPPDNSTPAVQQAAGEALAEFQAAHTNETISMVQTQVLVFQAMTPFQSSNLNMIVWRSTNLVNWDRVGTNTPGNTWTDLNPPQPCGFYKQTLVE